MADIVSFSGGKDSTAMLFKMIENGDNIDEVLNVDIRGYEFKENLDHIEIVKKKLEALGIKFTVLHADVTYGELLPTHGWTTMFNRWCTKKLKVDVMRKYIRENYPEDIIFEHIGITYDERSRAVKKEKVRALTYYPRYPLIKMRMTEQDCLDYCREIGFDWNGYYDKFDRLSCNICPLQNLSALRTLYRDYPEHWEKLRHLESLIDESTNMKIARSFRKNYTIKDLEDKFDKEIAEGKFLSKIKKKFK